MTATHLPGGCRRARSTACATHASAGRGMLRAASDRRLGAGEARTRATDPMLLLARSGPSWSARTSRATPTRATARGHPLRDPVERVEPGAQLRGRTDRYGGTRAAPANRGGASGSASASCPPCSPLGLERRVTIAPRSGSPAPRPQRRRSAGRACAGALTTGAGKTSRRVEPMSGLQRLDRTARGALCITCVNARTEARTEATARLLFEAPWLGYGGTAALVDGLSSQEYGSIRRGCCALVGDSSPGSPERLSRDGLERVIASSYVVLKSELPPERIGPQRCATCSATSCNDFIFGTEQQDEDECRTTTPANRSKSSKVSRRCANVPACTSATPPSAGCISSCTKRSTTPSTKRWRATRRTWT